MYFLLLSLHASADYCRCILLLPVVGQVVNKSTVAAYLLLPVVGQVVNKSTVAHDRHDFGDAGRLLYDFFWGEFADWYIEAAKARLYGQDAQAASQTRRVCLYHQVILVIVTSASVTSMCPVTT